MINMDGNILLVLQTRIRTGKRIYPDSLLRNGILKKNMNPYW